MSATVTIDIDGPGEVVRAWLAAQTFGSLHPIAVDLTRGPDYDDRDSWFFEVRLPNPAPGADTWSTDDTIALRVATRDKALAVGLAWPWYVSFSPESEVEPEEPAEDTVA